MHTSTLAFKLQSQKEKESKSFLYTKRRTINKKKRLKCFATSEHMHLFSLSNLSFSSHMHTLTFNYVQMTAIFHARFALLFVKSGVRVRIGRQAFVLRSTKRKEKNGWHFKTFIRNERRRTNEHWATGNEKRKSVSHTWWK